MFTYATTRRATLLLLSLAFCLTGALAPANAHYPAPDPLGGTTCTAGLLSS